MYFYSTKEVGSKHTITYKVYFENNGEIISPFHDIPYKNNEMLFCVNEIPRFENAKFEICKKEEMNPIMHDIKDDSCRYVKNIFPFKGYPWNYGAIPQTWEDPKKKDKFCQISGDNDPLDVIEIGSRIKNVGEVYEAKVLGSIALLDDGECDWKIIVIDSKDDKFDLVNDIDDIEIHFPGLLKYTRLWFKNYKKPTHNKYNEFGLDGIYQNKSKTWEVIEECHCNWKSLVDDFRQENKICIKNRRNEKSLNYLEEPFVVEAKQNESFPVPHETYVYEYIKYEE